MKGCTGTYSERLNKNLHLIGERKKLIKRDDLDNMLKENYRIKKKLPIGGTN